jgi:predicted  nucleic acid-binding Zn-ribbon protein
MRHASLVEYWQGKCRGQEARCKDLGKELEHLQDKLSKQRKELAKLNNMYTTQKDYIERLKDGPT